MHAEYDIVQIVETYSDMVRRLWVTVSASVHAGCLSINGQDLGQTVADAWGDDEYEYFYRFDRKNTARLFSIAGDGVLTAEEILLRRFRGMDGCRAMQVFCEENGIHYAFSSYC